MKTVVRDILGDIIERIPNNCRNDAIFDSQIDESEIGQAFGLALKAARKVKDVSLIKLSEAVDIPNPSISRYENGLVVPTIPQAVKLTAYFGLNIELFIYIGLLGLQGDDMGSIYSELIAHQ